MNLRVLTWKTRPEECPERYCACGYDTSHLWIPGERTRHTARHRSYREGKPLPKSFPFERIDDAGVVCVSGTETGVVSRTVYYLARDFNRQCGFDFVLWPYLGRAPIGEQHVAYLYTHEKTYAVGVLLGRVDGRFDTGEAIPAIVRMVYTAGAHRCQGIARVLAERFAADRGIAVAELAWEGPVTAVGAAVIESVGGPEALLVR